MNTMKYKSYTATIEFDAIDQILVGHVIGVKQTGGFHADNIDDLEQAFHETVEHYLVMCQHRGTDAIKPYSGKITLRIDPSIHAAIAHAAQLKHISINKFITYCLTNVVHAD